MRQAELINHLEGMGFVTHQISRHACYLYLSKGEQTLFIRVKKTAPYGVDFKITSSTEPDGYWNEHNYNTSSMDIHSYILRIAREFMDHEPTPIAHNKVEINEYDFDYNDPFEIEDNSLSDLYESLSDCCNYRGGELVYLSDGMWLGPDGSIHDLGR